MTDIFLTNDGDITFDSYDVKLSMGEEYIKRKLYTLIFADKGDFRMFGSIGASPDKFIGEENTRETAERIRSYLYSNLKKHFPQFNIIPIITPIDYDSVICEVRVLEGNNQITEVIFSLDYVNGITIRPINTEVNNYVSSKTTIHKSEQVDKKDINPYLSYYNSK